jgi:hypothetical protein
MKVGKSPEAVTARLKLMDELWIMSVKLMNSKIIDLEKDESRELPDDAGDKGAAGKEN